MSHTRLISVTGLGYVGLPVAVAFARAGTPTVGFDIDPRRIEELRAGHDRTGEIAADRLRDLQGLTLTDDPAMLGNADFHIVTVPTPIDNANRPDLRALIGASRTLGARLKRNDVVVYESTVYPGATEEVCVPELERASGLKGGVDFVVGYSPERINPGDHAHRFETIPKVVSGMDAATLDIVAGVYGSVVTAGIHRAPTIRVAETAKVLENTQRDVNIALINELALICHRLDIDTRDVLAAAATKWNFLPFRPGLVGGHCIGVDPFYLTHRAEQAGYHPEMILSGRRVNDSMGHYVARRVIRELMQRRSAEPSRVTILGVTFKEDVPDIRNTRVADIARDLLDCGAAVQIVDPLANAGDLRREYDLELTPLDAALPADAVVLAVAHRAYVEGSWGMISRLLKPGSFVADVQAILDRRRVPAGVTLWRL
jgi:UDP-N-acetyl-D-glucosamine/UDP-N-acetyl-D-galactosamine dehydrogenase